MPLKNGVGFGETTKIKQLHFATIVDLHIRIVEKIFKKHNWKPNIYRYFDINAGPGLYDGFTGSPLVFLNAISKYPIQYEAFFIEKQKNSYDELLMNLNTRQMLSQGSLFSNNCIHVHCSDHKDILNQFFYKSSHLGMLYSDENGSIPPFELLAEFAKHQKNIDILINFSASNIKRVRSASFTKLDKTLIELISLVPKKHWLIRDPFGKHQWSFLIGTNWADFPAYKRIQIHGMDTKEGMSIVKKLNYTREEYENIINQDSKPI